MNILKTITTGRSLTQGRYSWSGTGFVNENDERYVIRGKISDGSQQWSRVICLTAKNCVFFLDTFRALYGENVPLIDCCQKLAKATGIDCWLTASKTSDSFYTQFHAPTWDDSSEEA